MRDIAMLMKTISSETNNKINFIKDFFNSHPQKEPANLEKYYIDAERNRNIIDYVYRMIRMEISSILNINYIAAYAYSENKNGLKNKFNDNQNDFEFKKIVEAGIAGIK